MLAVRRAATLAEQQPEGPHTLNVGGPWFTALMTTPPATSTVDRRAIIDRFGVAVPATDPDGELEQLLLDDLIELQAREALIEARRARTINQLREIVERRVAGRHRSAAGVDSADAPPRQTDARGNTTWNPAFTARRELATELATLLRESERTAETRIAHAELLGAQLHETADALERAVITPRHAQLIADRACDLPPEARAEFERLAVAAAERMGVAPFARRVRRLRELLHPEPLEKRATTAADGRWVAVEPASDAMAYLTAYLPAVDAVAIHDRVTTIARDLAGDGETRTAAQRRADVFTALLVAGEVPGADANVCGGGEARTVDGATVPGSTQDALPLGRGIRARVSITVPALTLLGRVGADVPTDRRPAHLEGYGPIDDETAARWAARAPSFRRILTDPHTGAVLSVGRERYTVPADLAAALRVRDDTCRFPGCVRAASSCELDHTVDWAHGGHTAADNLAHLCRAHHRLKHRTSWGVKHLGAGRLEWTSPRHRIHITEPFGGDDPPRTRHGDERTAPPAPTPQRDDGSPPKRVRRTFGSTTPLPDDAPF
ncbi:uncharacterized protein DUF222 [Microcella putealis]|uniref:Uncharacterized protein DUF222 n=2 Tax=Microcella putealis TaxID=337005 RepID=A0A4Q7LXD5_9MICO|nr:uncharacterized protein DUF222 [Microcella putealis]TQM24239.1 uncharacterized protein DUF222 [Microcella putealis]